MEMRAAIAVAVFAAIASLHAQTQSVSGRVVADATGEPLVNARVAINSTQSVPGVLSDRDGRFSIGTPAGKYSVVASKTGYASREITSSGNGPIEIRLQRAAAISGQVVDEFGDPVVEARLIAESAVAPPAPAATVATTFTDDLGEYRLPGLATGVVTVA